MNPTLQKPCPFSCQDFVESQWRLEGQKEEEEPGSEEDKEQDEGEDQEEDEEEQMQEAEESEDPSSYMLAIVNY